MKAEIIEPVGALAKAPEPVIEYTLPTAKVGNTEQIEAFVSRIEEFFADVRIDPCDAEQAKQLKGLRADVNKVANAINAKRVAMDKDVKASISEADGVLNGLRDRLKAVYDSTGKQIAQAEEWWLSCRIELLQAEYEGVAPDLAQLVPLGAFTAREKRLVQKSWKDAKACKEFDDMVCKAVEDRQRVRDMELSYPVEADAVFCRTLSIEAAMDEDKRLRDAAKARAEHEARARELDRKVGAAPEPEPEPQAESSMWGLFFQGDKMDAVAVKTAVECLGIPCKCRERTETGWRELCIS